MHGRFVVAFLLGSARAHTELRNELRKSGGSLEEIMAEMADSKVEHQALAKYYGEQAGKARALARATSRWGGPIWAVGGGRTGSPS